MSEKGEFIIGEIVIIMEGPYEDHDAEIIDIKPKTEDFRYTLKVIPFYDGEFSEEVTYECDDHEFEYPEK